MPRIAIDARFAVHNRRGIGNYTLKLIRNLAEIDRESEYILYADRDDVERVLPERVNFETKIICPSNYLVWEQFALPLQAMRDAVDILHCTGNTAPISLPKRIKLITTIHDVMYLKDYSELPKSASLYQRMGRVYRKIIVPRAARHVSMLLTVSEFSKNDILKHIPELDKKRIKTIHEAAGESYRQIDKVKALEYVNRMLNISGNYVLALGALDPRKNTELLIKSVLDLKQKNIMIEKLVIVGIPNWKESQFFRMIKGSKFETEILFTDYVSEEDLTCLYNGATVFLYPSLYEGFGIPPLEAMTCGVPVITSNTTSIPEVVGDAAVLINPQNGEELTEALLTLLSDETLRNTLRKRGFERANQFSWLKMAKQTLEAYQEVYQCLPDDSRICLK